MDGARRHRRLTGKLSNRIKLTRDEVVARPDSARASVYPTSKLAEAPASIFQFLLSSRLPSPLAFSRLSVHSISSPSRLLFLAIDDARGNELAGTTVTR